MLLPPCLIITRIHGIARNNAVNAVMTKAICKSRQAMLSNKKANQAASIVTSSSIHSITRAPMLPSTEYQHLTTLSTHPLTHSQQSHHRSSSNHHSSRNLRYVRRRRPLSILSNNTNLRLDHARKVRLRARREGRKPGRLRGAGKRGLDVSGVVLDTG